MEDLNKEITVEAYKIKMELVREIGITAYRFLLTLNTGAFVVLFAFIGAAHGASNLSLAYEGLRLGMIFFLASIFFVFLSMTIAYLHTQLELVGRSLPGSKGIAGSMIWLMFPVVVSFACFFCGALTAVSSFAPS